MDKKRRVIETKKSAALDKSKARGKYFDLQKIFDKLNREYFEGQIKATIVWSKRKQVRKIYRKTMEVGNYSVEQRMITINSALDRSFVPLYYVACVVHHEMLHHKYSTPFVPLGSDGRRLFHTSEFKKDEKLFRHYDRSVRWERKNLPRLKYY